jgi:ABC-type multidrug transport system fused ATPase/permease subunit
VCILFNTTVLTLTIIISGVTTIRAFDAQDRFLTDSLTRIDAMNRPTYHLSAANRWLSWRTYLAGSLVSFFTALFILISLDHIDAGLAGFTLSTALMFSEITMWTVTFYGMLEMSMNGVERVHEYLQIEQEPSAIIETSRPSSEVSCAVIINVHIKVEYLFNTPAYLYL